jgi:hypothetical protein
MKKDTFYFSHDYEPTADPKIQAMLGEFGAVGYGLYWRIVEMLHSDADHKLAKKQYIYIALSKQMSTSVEHVSAFVDKCVSVFELFVEDENFFWSERVLRNIEKRENISKKRSFAGKKSVESKKIGIDNQEVSTCVEHMSTSVQQNSTKERKGKERKRKEIKEKKESKRKGVYNMFLPDPEINEFIQFFTDNGFDKNIAEEAWHRYDANNWHDSNGVKIENWKRQVKLVYFRKENKSKNEKPKVCH